MIFDVAGKQEVCEFGPQGSLSADDQFLGF